MADSKKFADAFLRLSRSHKGEHAVDKLIEYIKKKGLESLFPQIKRYITKQAETLKQSDTLFIRSKFPLEESGVNEIKKIVQAPADVDIKSVIDDTIIGGFSATYRGNIYDGSLRSQISQLEERLKHS